MKVEQLYTSCLAQGAYYIESNGEAAVIDPLRDVSQYIKLANQSNSKIKYVFETHFHADFISGHLSLANLTDAQIVYGPKADPNYDSLIAEVIVKDGDRDNTINKMKMALTELVIEGIKTNQPLHLKILDDDGFKSINYYIKYLEEELIK